MSWRGGLWAIALLLPAAAFAGLPARGSDPSVPGALGYTFAPSNLTPLSPGPVKVAFDAIGSSTDFPLLNRTVRFASQGPQE